MVVIYSVRKRRAVATVKVRAQSATFAD